MIFKWVFSIIVIYNILKLLTRFWKKKNNIRILKQIIFQIQNWH